LIGFSKEIISVDPKIEFWSYRRRNCPTKVLFTSKSTFKNYNHIISNAQRFNENFFGMCGEKENQNLTNKNRW
jgi:hypothetical protein